MPPTRRAHTHRKASGFSLVEMAVVLVVIALLVGAVLQGRAMIDNARYKSFRQTLHAQRQAFHTFRERYHALPGDLKHAGDRLAEGQPSGDGNGLIDKNERYDPWQHLRAAGLLKGDPGLSGKKAPPVNDYGGHGSSFFSGGGDDDDKQDAFGPKLRTTEIPVEVAARLDREEDDGNCKSGRVTGLDCNGDEWPDDQETVDIVYGL